MHYDHTRKNTLCKSNAFKSSPPAMPRLQYFLKVGTVFRDISCTRTGKSEPQKALIFGHVLSKICIHLGADVTIKLHGKKIWNLV